MERDNSEMINFDPMRQDLYWLVNSCLLKYYNISLVSTPFMFIMGKVNRLSGDISAKGKTILITGCNRGIGRTTAIDLARRGASVIMACRNIEAASKVAEEIKSETGQQSATIISLDLSSLSSIKKAADEINSKYDKIDILINNAGIYGSADRKITEDGNEMHFQSNHLGPFLLTRLLLPKLKASSPSRIVNVSSEAHRLTRSIDLDDVNFEKKYSSFNAYCVTKLENILFTNYLARELKDSGVTVNALHPGTIETGLLNNSAFSKYFYGWLGPLKRLFVKSDEEGAQTTVYCALEPSLSNVTGKYFDNCKERSASSLATDLGLAKRLWDLSEKMTASYLGLKTENNKTMP
ncbi:retinol dehydrogenase 13 [Tetranychus urticae]|uniref:retinol dehydrogenase 13 n=1 Tax=Tetranychus urticae TaxID=32264 RepID=UPI00077C0CFB|nr:retinol dehydrogenase 13 [Tetranychus urticae]